MQSFLKTALNLLTRDDRKKRDPNYGPFFIDEYPQGFQLFDPRNSLINAYGVIKAIQQQVKDVELVSSSAAIINVVEVELMLLMNALDNEETDDKAKLDSLKLFITQFSGLLDALPEEIGDEDDHRSSLALADVLQIVRKSIPSSSFLQGTDFRLDELKSKAEVARNGLVAAIRRYEATPSVTPEGSSNAEGEERLKPS